MVFSRAWIPVFALGVAFAPSVHAQANAADKETARALMAEGRQDRDRGDVKGAMKAFAAADAIMHVPTTGIELAKTQAALGQLVEARETALGILRSPERPADPMPFKVAREAAKILADDLLRRIPSVTVVVKNVPTGASVEVTLDGAAVPPELVGQARRLNPGHYVLVAKTFTAERRREVDLAEGDAVDVVLDLPPPSVDAVESPPAPLETPPSNARRKGGSVALIYGGFGLAVAGAVTGTITGLLSISKTNSIKGSDACQGNQCGPAEYDEIHSAKSLATASTVAFIAAGAGVGLGVVGLLTGHSSSSAAKPMDETARVEPWFGAGALGLRGRF